jgi:hypothetical protein
MSEPNAQQSSVLDKIAQSSSPEAKLERRIEELRLENEARDAVRRERAAGQLRLPPERDSYTLKSYIDEPKLPKLERIAGLQRVGQDAALIAAYKTGKTTLTANLAKSLVDGTPFMGEFEVQALSGRVGFWNVEMDAEDFELYLREAKVENTDGVAIWNLRGHRLDLLDEMHREKATQWLKDQDVSYWVVDPWARICAWAQVNENENGPVSELLQRVREIADDAGVAELLLVHHAGYVQGRARGASVFSDNADVLWQYDRSEDDTRFLHVFGRGIKDLKGVVELEDDGVTRFRAMSRSHAKQSTAMHAAVDHVKANPGCNRTSVYDVLEITQTKKKTVVDEAVSLGYLTENQIDGRTKALFAVESVDM